MSQKHQILHYTVAYLLWIVSTALGIFTLTRIRDMILLAIVVSTSQGNPTESETFYRSLAARAVDTWSLLLLGLLVLILLVGIENLYRMSVPSRKVVKRFFLVTGIEFAVLFVSDSISALLRQTFQELSRVAIPILVVELLAAVIFFWLYRQRLKTVQVVPQ